MPRDTKLAKRTRAANAMRGLAKRFEPNEILVVAGRSYSVSQLTALIRRQITALDAVDAAAAVLRQAVRDESKVAREVTRLVQDLKLNILGVQGPQVAVLADFGWDVPKMPGPKRVKSKLVQVERARRTREAKKAALAAVKSGRRGS